MHTLWWLLALCQCLHVPVLHMKEVKKEIFCTHQWLYFTLYQIIVLHFNSYMCCIQKHDIVLCLPYIKPKMQNPPPPPNIFIGFTSLEQMTAWSKIQKDIHSQIYTNWSLLIFVKALMHHFIKMQHKYMHTSTMI